MPRFFDPLLRVIARATEPQLRAQIPFLKAENQVLRRCAPKRIRVTVPERKRFARFGHAPWTCDDQAAHYHRHAGDVHAVGEQRVAWECKASQEGRAAPDGS